MRVDRYVDKYNTNNRRRLEAIDVDMTNVLCTVYNMINVSLHVVRDHGRQRIMRVQHPFCLVWMQVVDILREIGWRHLTG